MRITVNAVRLTERLRRVDEQTKQRKPWHWLILYVSTLSAIPTEPGIDTFTHGMRNEREMTRTYLP
jgi:hypothetical protein